jgi:hypothetical protein
MKVTAMAIAPVSSQSLQTPSELAPADGRAMLNRRQCLLAAGAASGVLVFGTQAHAAAQSVSASQAARGASQLGSLAKVPSEFVVRIEGDMLGQGSAHTLHAQADQVEALWLAAPGGLQHAVYALTLSSMGDGPGLLLQWRPQTLEAGACGAATCNAFDIVLQEGVASQVPVVMGAQGGMSSLTIMAKTIDRQQMIVDAPTLALDH